MINPPPRKPIPVMDDNSELWRSVEATDPSATKLYERKGFSQTTLNGTYMIKRATDVFGPLGTGWAYEIITERFDDGPPVLDANGVVIAHQKIHTILLKTTAIWKGHNLLAMQYGHTPFLTVNKYGLSMDENYGKKTITDALKKCLSYWGFSADIYLGLFDDHEYIQAQIERERIDKTKDKDATRVDMEREYSEFIQKHIDLIKTATRMNELNALFQAAVKRAKRKSDEATVHELEQAAKKRKMELTKDPLS